MKRQVMRGFLLSASKGMSCDKHLNDCLERYLKAFKIRYVRGSGSWIYKGKVYKEESFLASPKNATQVRLLRIAAYIFHQVSYIYRMREHEVVSGSVTKRYRACTVHRKPPRNSGYSEYGGKYYVLHEEDR